MKNQLTLLVLCLLAQMATLSANAQDYSQPLPQQPSRPRPKTPENGMKTALENFTDFPKRKQVVSPLWNQFNSVKDQQHPEYGTLPKDAPCESCVEVYAGRAADARTFRDIRDTTLTYTQRALGNLNKLENGRWVTIDHQLQSLGNKRYASGNSSDPVQVDMNTHKVAIQTSAGTIAFNNWSIYTQVNGTNTLRDQANWSNYTIGADGIYVTNIFKGIDAKMIVYRGAVKTNFIIRSNEYGSFDALVFHDQFDGGSNTRLAYTNPQQAYSGGQNGLTVFVNNQDALRINEAIGYVEKGDKSSLRTFAYLLQQKSLDLLVPAEWINRYIGSGHLVVDPLVTATGTLAQAAITGSQYNSSCNFTNSCDYALSVPVAGGAVITDAAWTFTYVASGICWLEDGAIKISSGSCVSPSAGNIYWFCNGIGGGNCTGNNISIMSHLQSCFPAASCNNQNVNFSLRFFRSCYGASGCNNACIGAASPWTMTITTRTLELTNPATAITLSSTNVCAETSVTASASAIGGVAPYTYSWSRSSTGAPVVATGSPANITMPTAGSQTIYVRATDACGNTVTASRAITVNSLSNSVDAVNICSSELPYTWHGQTITSGGNAVATYITTSLVNGCDSTITLNLNVSANPPVTQTITICSDQLPYDWNGQTITSGGNAAATFTTSSVVSGCDSVTTLNLVVNALETVTEDIIICSDAMPYIWNGQTLHAGGMAIATYTTASVLTGCDSTTTLNLTVNPVANETETITICSNALPFTWNGQTLTAGGTAVATYTTASLVAGCDSTTTLNLIVNNVINVTEDVTICASLLPFSWNGQTFNATGSGTFTTASLVNGCDSTTTLNLTVNLLPSVTESITVCSDQIPYSWNGQNITVGGVAAATHITPSLITGCDSTTTLNLLVNPLPSVIEDIVICADQLPFTWNGHTLTAGGNAVATHVVAAALTGCDSTTTLNLTVNTLPMVEQDIIICANLLPYNWNGFTINSGGQGVATFVTPSLITGCDSTTILNLTVNPLLTTTESVVICSNQLPFAWNGYTLNNGGTAVSTFTTASLVTGCDSTITLNLTVNPLPVETETITICSNQLPYSWNGFTLTAAGNGVATFVTPSLVTGCDSTVTLNLQVNAVPVIGSDPDAQVIYINENASFSIAASGAGMLTYQWQVDDGTGFTDISNGGVYNNATTPTLTTSSAPLSMSGYLYRCMVSGICPPNVVSAVATLTVNKRPQAITFTNQIAGSTTTVTYGDPMIDAVATASSGLSVTYVSSNPAVVEVNASGQVTIRGVGTALIAAQQSGDAMYDAAADQMITIVVERKALYVTADNISRPYGMDNPTLTLTYSGFVYGENLSVVNTPPTPTTTAVPLSAPGTYEIAVSSGYADNYSLIISHGTFTVTGAVLVIERQPVAQTACFNEDGSFNIRAHAVSPLVTINYQWQHATAGTWSDIAGETGTEYTATGVNTRSIRCVLTAPGTTLPSSEVIFTVNQLPLVRASKSNDLNCNYGTTQLSVSGARSYVWSPATHLSGTTVSNPVASPTSPIRYYVSGTDRNGCVNRDSVTVEITTERLGENLVPSAFTPNGDGHNDCFGINYWGVVDKIEFSIFNRDGNRVFHTTDARGCWDGRFKGVPQVAGVYVYFIKANTNCGPVERKGTLVLAR